MSFELRIAQDSDIDAIEKLIRASARCLGKSDYSSDQIEAALETAFGVDSQLMADKTYYLVMAGESLVGCGGWSYRETLFGSDRRPDRSPALVDPETGAAKIRAFFVSPEYARMGVASMILEKCEREARRSGFRGFELMATLPGKRFYAQFGYQSAEPIEYPLTGQLTIEFVPMFKEVG